MVIGVCIFTLIASSFFCLCVFFLVSEIDQDGTTFNGVTSLGSSSINAPKSEIEIQRKMSELNSNHTDDSIGLKVSVTIPSCHDGYVV